MESLRGHLLVAGPGLVDPNFWRTVILVGEHSDEGALGLVLNRSSETTVEEALPEFALLAEGMGAVHVGGPVQPSSARSGSENSAVAVMIASWESGAMKSRTARPTISSAV